MSRGIEERKLIADLAKARGICVLSASSATQKAWESLELPNGLFTGALLTAVRERRSAISSEGFVSMDKLMNETMTLTRDSAMKLLKEEQTPIKYFFGEDFSIGTIK